MLAERTPGLAAYVQTSRYAQYLPQFQRRELWPEQVDRVFGMHAQFYGAQLVPIRALVNEARGAMLTKRALGSQRALQYGGKPILKINARINNCWGSFCDRPRFFQEILWILLCGGGAGYSVQKHHVAKLPGLVQKPFRGTVTHVIEDSIEGWADALGVLVSSFFESDDTPFPLFRGSNVMFDASLVRPKGAPISTGHKAPGPEPLLKALHRIKTTLARAAQARGFLRPIDAHDVICHASDSVLSGGVRRSACIAIFSADDHEMAGCKTGDWYKPWAEGGNKQRGRANNSALLLRGRVPRAQFNALLDHTRVMGDPGFLWSDSTEVVPNPCGEVQFWPVWVHENNESETGWQACNLSTVNGGLCDSPAAFYVACRAAATLGTLQAGYTDMGYLGPITRKIVEREALIGVSITGMMEQPDVLFDPAVLQAGARIVRETNQAVARAIGINVAARCTLLKPEGTSSCILDTSSGIHGWHSKRGIRHVQSNRMEPPLVHFASINPHAIESCAQAHDTTDVIAFAYEAPPKALTKDDVGALGLLERVLLVRRHWVEPGTRLEACAQPWLRHNVSNTVEVGDDEWSMVAEFIFAHQDTFSGVTLLPKNGDRIFEQAPFMRVYTRPELRLRYDDAALEEAAVLLETLPPTFQSLWQAHKLATAVVDETLTSREANWCVDYRIFTNTCGGATHAEACIKDVWALLRWHELRTEYTPVNWSELVEEDDNVDFGQFVACGGGACEISI